MESEIPELLVTAGPLKDRRFTVPAGALRLGRSSSCDIAVPDPALSRNHCLFEVRDGALWVTDLASANGTLVNDEQLGADSRRLAVGDVVAVGDTLLAVVAPGTTPGASAAPDAAAASAPAGEQMEKIDLGLGKAEEAPAAPKIAPVRLVLWAAAALAAVAVGLVVFMPPEGAEEEAPPVAPAAPALVSVAYEKVDAGPESICRFALSYDASNGVLGVTLDDVPKANRHVKKAVALTPAQRQTFEQFFADAALFKLEREYTGVPLRPNTLASFALRVARTDRVFETTVENVPEPEVFRALREKLETFSKNELALWAIQYSAEKLVAMSEESRRAGDAKWSERDVRHGNVAEALAAYREALVYLETVNPKPAFHGALAGRCREAEAELDKRYRDQRFLADRAINLSDWPAAQRELRVLCELVPDAKDPRHAEAANKLLDVENRLKKGGR